jgi:hypothetical protein
MKVVCINNNGLQLTIGKKYEVIKIISPLIIIHQGICIKNDSGDIFTYTSNLFITLKEERKRKLLKLSGCRL